MEETSIDKNCSCRTSSQCNFVTDAVPERERPSLACPLPSRITGGPFVGRGGRRIDILDDKTEVARRKSDRPGPMRRECDGPSYCLILATLSRVRVVAK